MERAEKIGLGIATAAHVLLFGVLSAGFLSTPNPLKLNSPPMDISLVDEVALQSTAPRISTLPPPPSQAPEVGPTEEAAPGEPVPAEPEVAPPPPAPKPKPVPKPAPAAKPVEQAKPKPAPATKPVERAKPKPPAPKPAAAKPAPKPAKPAPAAPRAKPAPPNKAAVKPAAPAKPATSGKGKAERARGSQLGPDFLKGIQSDAPARTPAPDAPNAAAVGPRQKAALDAEIRRQLKPYWKAPTGADADQLRTIVAVELSRDGSITGTPRIVDTTGESASNRTQVKLHQELAIKAIKLAAPFKLPADLYDGWKSLQIGFDKRLSQ